MQFSTAETSGQLRSNLHPRTTALTPHLPRVRFIASQARLSSRIRRSFVPSHSTGTITYPPTRPGFKPMSMMSIFLTSSWYCTGDIAPANSGTRPRLAAGTRRYGLQPNSACRQRYAAPGTRCSLLHTRSTPSYNTSRACTRPATYSYPPSPPTPTALNPPAWLLPPPSSVTLLSIPAHDSLSWRHICGTFVPHSAAQLRSLIKNQPAQQLHLFNLQACETRRVDDTHPHRRGHLPLAQRLPDCGRPAFWSRRVGIILWR